MTDKYVGDYKVGSDYLNARLNRLRQTALFEIATNLAFVPLAVVGQVLHAPLAAFARAMGRRLGVADDGDVSVVATWRVLAGFAGVVVSYPAAAVTAAVATGSLAAAPLTLAFLAASGYAAATRPVANPVSSFWGSIKILTADDTVDKLRVQRAALQQDVRDFADANSEG
jgi:hypothetical protein